MIRNLLNYHYSHNSHQYNRKSPTQGIRVILTITVMTTGLMTQLRRQSKTLAYFKVSSHTLDNVTIYWLAQWIFDSQGSWSSCSSQASLQSTACLVMVVEKLICVHLACHLKKTTTLFRYNYYILSFPTSSYYNPCW